jgi:hypothetical protein
LPTTCAKPCRRNGGDLEKIKFLLGHSSIQTTERYLGSDQEIVVAVIDDLGLRGKLIVGRLIWKQPVGKLVDGHPGAILFLDLQCFGDAFWHARMLEEGFFTVLEWMAQTRWSRPPSDAIQA